MGAFSLLVLSQAFAQNTTEAVTNKNSWLKAGISASAPVGSTSNYSSFALGADLSGQVMATPNLGLGVASGYTHYFGKNGVQDFGVIPLGALIRYYPAAQGVFVGSDVGYSFLTNAGSNGGFYIKPQLGYHNYDWNFYAFYNQVFVSSPGSDVQNLGVTATYNIRFK